MVSACTGAVPPLKCLEYISALTQTPVCFFMAGACAKLPLAARERRHERSAAELVPIPAET